MSVKVDLTVMELLCSRLCHELINPVGAINNGVELLSELENAADPEAMGLIAQSARSAAARLHFYRLAYGRATGLGADLTMDEALAVAEGVVETNRVHLERKANPSDRSGAAAERLDRAVVKLLLNLLVLGGEALSRGGRLRATVLPDGDGRCLEVLAEGEQAGLPPESGTALHGRIDVANLTARTVQAYFTGRVAEALPVSLETVESRGFVRFSAKLPAPLR
ncbi:MAG TPA: histidine phosphotransferase family protein [Alphaproteobacteria bacterium]